MTERSKRRFPLLKSLVATGLIGGAGAGAYYYHAIGAQEPERAAVTQDSKSATLDAVVEAWSADAVAAPVAEAPKPAGEAPPPLPAGQPLPPAPEPDIPADRYAASPAPVDLPPAIGTPLVGDKIARGQDAGDGAVADFSDPEPATPPSGARPSSGNSLRSGAPDGANPLRAGRAAVTAGSEPARAAFSDAAPPQGPSSEAAAAFSQAQGTPEVAHTDQNVTPAAAEAPLPAMPGASPAPEGMPGDDGAGELSAPPEAFNPFPTEGPSPAPAPGNDPAAPREMPEAAGPPNPLRAAPSSEPEPLQPTGADPYDGERSVMTQEPLGLDQEPQGSAETAPAPLASASEGTGRPGERALEGRQQPTLAIQKFAPAEIQVGKPCKFLVKVRNVGQRPATDIEVHDQVPEGTRLTATTPQAQVAGGEVTWSIGALSPGEERTLEMELTPMEEGEIGSVATVTFSAAASAKTTCTRPQLALRMTAPSKVMVGREQTIQIEVKNPGTGDATNVMILENVPDNLRHDAGPVLEYPIGTLRPGQTRTLQLKMLAESPGRVVNTLAASADGDLHVEQHVEFDVVAPALQLAVDGPKRRYLERPATYQVKLLNPGTASAKDVRLVTRLPRGMRFVKANHMGEYDANTHAVYWSLAELPEGESNAAVELTALPVTPGDHKLQVQCEARDGLRVDAEHGTQVEGISAIDFAVIDVEDPIEVGGETEYEVRVSNQGSKEAANVRVQAAAPAGVRIISAAGDARHRIQGGVVHFEPIPHLAPKSEMTFRIRAQGVQPGDHRLVVEVGADDLAQPVRKEESTRVFGDE